MSEHWTEIATFLQNAELRYESTKAAEREKVEALRVAAEEEEKTLLTLEEERRQASRLAARVNEPRVLEASAVVFDILKNIDENVETIFKAPIEAHKISLGTTVQIGDDTQLHTTDVHYYFRWGKKIDLTEEDQEKIERFNQRKFKFLAPHSQYPRAIVEEDYSEISVSVNNDRVQVKGAWYNDPKKLETKAILESPTPIYPLLADTLGEPTINYRERERHNNYQWRKVSEKINNHIRSR